MEDVIFELGLAVGLMAIALFLARRLHISAVPILILIGLAVGPHVPRIGLLDLRFIHSHDLIMFLGRVGILFLLFFLGLEFSIGRLIRAGRSIVIASAIYIYINLTLGLLFGFAFGFPIKEVLIITGITTISSSAIVAKVLVDLRRSARPETGLILGIIMGEDVFLALYMAVVSSLVLFTSTSAIGALLSIAVSVLFVLALFAFGRFFAARLRRPLSEFTDEGLILLAFGVLFLIAGLGETLGVAEAIGALMVGLVMAETGHGDRLQRLGISFRDFFGAFVFFSFGLSIDPLSLGGGVLLALAAAGMTIVGNLAAGLIVGKVTGLPGSAGTTIGLTILSRGEFSIVMAGLAKSGGLMAIIQPFAAVYVLLLSVLGPVLTKETDRVYAWWQRLLDRTPA